MKNRYSDGQRVRYQGEVVVVEEDDGGDRVQIQHANGACSYVSRWNLEKEEN